MEDVEGAHSPHDKAQTLHSSLMEKINEVLPVKTIKVSDDDQPWCNEEVKKTKRLKQREYRKHRRSDKYFILIKQYEASITKAKS